MPSAKPRAINRALVSRPQKPSIKYVYPKEGAIGWMDNVAVPAGAPDVDNAKLFLNFLIDSKKNIALQQRSTGCQSAIVGSNKFLSTDIGASPEFNPPADLKITFAPSCPEKATRAYKIDLDRFAPVGRSRRPAAEGR